jgi:nitrite reductase/ring-hydroxylating ferredoxin subunit
MAWTTVLKEADLPPGSRQVVKVEQQTLLLLNEGGRIFAVSNTCPHLKLPLKSGKVSESGGLVCPFHRSEFDLATGAVKCWTPFPPGIGKIMGMITSEKSLPVFPVRQENGEILVELPA